jgi:repressor LexA
VPKALTDRQRSILDFISASIRENGVSPSYREIAANFNITAGGLQKQIVALETKGVLRRATDRAARGLQVLGGQEIAGQVRLPILGQVRAGLPVEAMENVEDHLVLDRALAKGADFVLRVKGDSMVPEIVEGDLLLVRQAATARSGESVVAHVGGGDATVKRLKKANGQVWLEAANPKYSPIKARDLKVIGRVVGLVRKFG